MLFLIFCLAFSEKVGQLHLRLLRCFDMCMPLLLQPVSISAAVSTIAITFVTLFMANVFGCSQISFPWFTVGFVLFTVWRYALLSRLRAMTIASLSRRWLQSLPFALPLGKHLQWRWLLSLQCRTAVEPGR